MKTCLCVVVFAKQGVLAVSVDLKATRASGYIFETVTEMVGRMVGPEFATTKPAQRSIGIWSPTGRPKV